MLRRSALYPLVSAVLLFATGAYASPLSVIIEDYDFTFDTDFLATYNYNGSAADMLHVMAGGSDVGSYRFLGMSAPVDLLGNPPGLYPVWTSAAPLIYGGDLLLDMAFTLNDGPYVSGGDIMDISLTGSAGKLTITGIIGNPMPAAVPPMVLLDMDLTATSLLGRANDDVIDLIEGVGKVNILLGEDVSGQGLGGCTFMKFFATTGTLIFPDPPGQAYDPLLDYGYQTLEGRVSGEAGVPEPGAMLLLAAGALAVLRRRR